LTAERDILSNTLEQTKRDYNREMQARQALQNRNSVGLAGKAGGSAASGGSFGSTLKLIVVSGLLFVAGVKIGDSGFAPHLPVIGNFFIEDVPVIDPPPPTPENTPAEEL
jgi:hypothetical protein